MQMIKDKSRTAICEYCGKNHEVLEIYVKRIAHLEKIVDGVLVECLFTNMKYITIEHKSYVLN